MSLHLEEHLQHILHGMKDFLAKEWHQYKPVIEAEAKRLAHALVTALELLAKKAITKEEAKLFVNSQKDASGQSLSSITGIERQAADDAIDAGFKLVDDANNKLFG